MKDVFRCCFCCYYYYYYPPVDKDQYTFLLVDVLKKNAGNLILVLIKLIVTVCSDHYCRFFFIIVEGMDYNRVPACSLAKLVHKNITIDQVTEHTFGEGGIRLKYVHSFQVYKTIDHDHHYLYYTFPFLPSFYRISPLNHLKAVNTTV